LQVTTATPGEHSSGKKGALVLGAIGVVFGDIGTSPLYTLQECFQGEHGMPVSPDNIVGIASLILWALIVVVALKYVLFVMRADNKGEGGIFALLALAERGKPRRPGPGRLGFLMGLGLCGAALFYGDGMITPAVSVLSAVEGLEVAAPSLEVYVVPITVFVLVLLFFIQSRGTAKVGALFGPVMILWFLVIGVSGLLAIIDRPEILVAINPFLGFHFLLNHGFLGFLVLGSVVLAVTGGEALYADMGHFGRWPIQIAWFAIVMPALVLNYFGQSALLLADPEAIKNPFFLLLPNWALYPMIILATAATVIASQAVISGVYSLTRQAVQLGFCPRMEIRHTSDEEEGQIYIPRANWGLLIGVVTLVIAFKSSANLAAAYGIAVTGTMVATTIIALVVARRIWHWKLATCILLGTAFLVVDTAFFSANLVKVAQGGWIPLAVGAAVMLLMSTWWKGRGILTQRLGEESLPLEIFLKRQAEHPATKVPGTAVFMTGNADMVPVALLHNLKHNKVLHERIVFMTVMTENEPRISAKDRLVVEGLADGFYRLTVRYGFFQEPDIPKVLRLCKAFGLEFDLMQTSFFVGRETLVPSLHPIMATWREQLFVVMMRNAVSATEFFRIPANRVVELGAQVKL